jgi:hypothetical protein
MKQLLRKILKEQEEIITVPDFDFFNRDWEELLDVTNGRKFRVRGDLNFRKICPETLENMVAVDGDLVLYSCKNITSLGSLEYVGGYLNLAFCHSLKSLGNLKYVGNNLYINRTPIAMMYSEEEIRQMVEVKGLIYF